MKNIQQKHKTSYRIKLFIIKVLKRIKFLSLINFNIRNQYNNTQLKIPFIKGMGLENFLLRINWLDLLIKLFVDENKGAFVDVGVNLGQTLIKIKTKYPKIEYLGFEPNSACVFYTNCLIEINNFVNCTIQNYALNNNIQNLTFEKSSIADSRASVVSSLRPDFFIYRQIILGMPYDILYNSKPISFIKIDVEGAELDVLFGMRNAIEKHQPIITCEVLDSHSSIVFDFTQNRATLLSNLLKEMNYAIVNLETYQNSIISYRILDSIKLKQWTKESQRFNDYLFIPNKLTNTSLDILNTYIKKIN